MTKGRWFIFFLWRAIAQRRMRFLIASLAVTLAVTVLVGMTGLSLGIREKLGETLKAYGANVIVTAGDGGDMELGIQERIQGLASVESITAQLYGRVHLGESTLEVLGVQMERLREQAWRMEGRWPEEKWEVLVGASLREALGKEIGQDLDITWGRMTARVKVSGFLERGGDEDRSIFLRLEDAGLMFGKPGLASMFLVRSSGEPDTAVREIRQVYPAVTAKSLQQVARAETSLLEKIQLLMALVTLVVLVASVISVGSTMGATVLERREEIGLMKAIGGTRRSVGLFYTFEAAVMGLFGGLLGIPLGYLSAQLVSKGAFGSFVSVPLFLGVLGPLVGISIAVISGWFPVRDAMKPQASEILRGE